MARKNESPQKAAMREMMHDYLKNNDISIKDGTDVNSIMRDMMSVLLEGALDEELDEELGYSKYDYRNKETDNSRNGHSSKTMHTSYGDMDVAIPRDRNGEYEPQLIKKYQNTVTQDMEEKILSMYAKGMTTGDIESHMKELYDMDISDSTISRITDKILPIVKEWQERPLEKVYAVVFMDAIHYKFLLPVFGKEYPHSIEPCSFSNSATCFFIRTSISRFAERALYSATYRNFFNKLESILNVYFDVSDCIPAPPYH